MHLITKIYALTESGRLVEAAQLAAAAYDATPPTAPPDALMWLAHQRGRVALRCGHIRLLGAGCAKRSLGVGNAAASARSDLSCQHWRSPRRAPATSRRPTPRLPSSTSCHRSVRRAGAGVGTGVGARRDHSGYGMGEAILLHDVARLGDPASVAVRLGALASVCEGAMVPIWAAHAAAAASARPSALVDVADRFEALGAVLFAAEAASESAHAYQRQGDRRAAAALGLRAETLPKP